MAPEREIAGAVRSALTMSAHVTAAACLPAQAQHRAPAEPSLPVTVIGSRIPQPSLTNIVRVADLIISPYSPRRCSSASLNRRSPAAGLRPEEVFA